MGWGGVEGGEKGERGKVTRWSGRRKCVYWAFRKKFFDGCYYLLKRICDTEDKFYSSSGLGFGKYRIPAFVSVVSTI
jgi:hypothetical protein